MVTTFLLAIVNSSIGINRKDTVGLCGWKYFEKGEEVTDDPAFLIPAAIVDCLKKL